MEDKKNNCVKRINIVFDIIKNKFLTIDFILLKNFNRFYEKKLGFNSYIVNIILILIGCKFQFAYIK